MPIQFQCPHCQTAMTVDDAYAGTSGPCRHCDQTIQIPGGPAASDNVYAAPIAPPSPSPVYGDLEPTSHGDDAAMRFLLPVGRSVWAVVAGYLGLISILLFPAPFAIICGIIAIWDIKKSKGKKHGLGRAWFAIIFPVVCVAGFFLLIAIGSSRH